MLLITQLVCHHRDKAPSRERKGRKRSVFQDGTGGGIVREAPDRPRQRLLTLPLPSQLPLPVSTVAGQLSPKSSERLRVERFPEGDEVMEERRMSSDGTGKLCAMPTFGLPRAPSLP